MNHLDGQVRLSWCSYENIDVQIYCATIEIDHIHSINEHDANAAPDIRFHTYIIKLKFCTYVSSWVSIL